MDGTDLENVAADGDLAFNLAANQGFDIDLISCNLVHDCLAWVDMTEKDACSY